MTSYKNFIVGFGFTIQNSPPIPNLSKIMPISCQICKFLHFSIPQHIHNKRLPWQHLSTMRIITKCNMTPRGVKLNFKNFILISCGVTELLKKVFQWGAESAPTPPGEVGLTKDSHSFLSNTRSKNNLPGDTLNLRGVERTINSADGSISFSSGLFSV